MTNDPKRRRSIRGRFILVVLLSTLPFFAAVSLTTFFISLNSRNRLQEQIEYSTKNIHNLIDSMLKSTVESYLKAKVETGHDLVTDVLQAAPPAEYTEKAGPSGAGKGDGWPALEPVIDTLLSLQVGENGYFYAVDSDGNVVFHPDKNISGTDQSEKEPVPEQLQKQDGYLEYMWQNTFEEEPRRKALYMSYIPELDWILTATSYRREFTSIIDLEALESSVEDISIGQSGYSYIVDRGGNMITHPYWTGDNAEEILNTNEYKSIVSNLFNAGEGFTRYLWRDNASEKKKEKIVYVDYLPDFEWIIGTALYRDELNRPIITLIVVNSVIALIVAAVLFFVIYRINTSIETQLVHIRAVLRQSVTGDDLSIRAEESGFFEIKELAGNLNVFLEQLEEKTGTLSASLKEKEHLIQEIQHRVKNNLQTISSLLNLQRDSSRTEETVTILRNTQNRINSMAIVYDQMLLGKGNFSNDSLELNIFLQQYISSIISSYRSEAKNITISTNFDTVVIRRNKAISCGLIVNELLSSIVEDAFTEGESGRIEIRLTKEEPDSVLLSLHTNGNSSNRPGGTYSFGLGLVQILVQQLNENYTTVNTAGCEHRIVFPQK